MESDLLRNLKTLKLTEFAVLNPSPILCPRGRAMSASDLLQTARLLMTEVFTKSDSDLQDYR
jgi:hypothetical protein